MAGLEDMLRSSARGGNIGKPLMLALLALLASGALFGRGGSKSSPGKASQSSSDGGAGGLLGGLGGLLDKLQKGGLGDAVNSWVSSGPNPPVSPSQLGPALGPDIIKTLAQRSGLSEEEITKQLSRILPGVVDKLTPQGRLPTLAELSQIEPEEKFLVSDKLVDLLYEGQKANFAIVQARSEKGVEAIPSPSRETRETLTARILEVIASRAQRMQLRPNNRPPLLVGKTFDYEFVLEVTENVAFRIDAGTVFFDHLRSELVSFLEGGGMIGGEWGQLVCKNNRIAFELSAAPPKRKTNWQKPSRIEIM